MEVQNIFENNPTQIQKDLISSFSSNNNNPITSNNKETHPNPKRSNKTFPPKTHLTFRHREEVEPRTSCERVAEAIARDLDRNRRRTATRPFPDTTRLGLP